MTAPKVYVTDHQHSRVIGSAMATGCGGQIVPPLRLLDGPAVVYGILRGCDKIIKQCQWIHRDFYHIDLGYFKRGHYDGYYRITKNAFQREISWMIREISDSEPDRFDVLGVPIRPWIRKGRDVIVCPISSNWAEFVGIDKQRWLEVVCDELDKHTDRPIIIKEKNQGNLAEILSDAWCIVTHSSNAAVDAIMNGIPAIVLGQSAAAPVSWSFTNIEEPVWPERLYWAQALAHYQFTIAEMRSGLAWEYVSRE